MSARYGDSWTMEEQENLERAAEQLPLEIQAWLRIAFQSGRHRIGAFSYASELAVCPVVAAAQEAGVWDVDHVVAGHPAWGTPEGASEEVEEFAAWFDLAAEAAGLGAALNVVAGSLALTICQETT